jgi:hypothetical protein
VIPMMTLMQRLTPLGLQGRTYSAAELLITGPQTASIAGGAALIAFVDYRALVAAEALAGAVAAVYLLTRHEPAPAAARAARVGAATR